MPLSEEELRLLEQMERALVEEDPKFASTLRGTSFRRSARRKAAVAGVAFTAGIALLMVGVITQLWFVGLAGFVIMLASATIALSAIRGQQIANGSDPRTASTQHPSGFGVIDGGKSRSPRSHGRIRKQRSHGSFMERMEERWRRRREEGL